MAGDGCVEGGCGGSEEENCGPVVVVVNMSKAAMLEKMQWKKWDEKGGSHEMRFGKKREGAWLSVCLSDFLS